MQYTKWVTLGFSALCLVAVATVLRMPHLYYMAAILLTLPGISYLLGWSALRGLEFSRELPSLAWEGDAGAIFYAVRNRSRFSRFFLSIHEPLPSWILATDAEPSLFNVAAYDETEMVHPVIFQKRGVYQVSAFDVTAMDPLGVFAFTKHVPSHGELVVYPLPVGLALDRLGGADRYGWQDLLSSLTHGTSVDPDGTRPYVQGDPLRRIHWRQTARTGKLTVTEFEEPRTQNLVIVLDAKRGTEAGKGADTTLEYGVKLAASAAYEAIKLGASVSLVTPDPSSPDGNLDEAYTRGEGGSMRPGAIQSSRMERGQDHLFSLFDQLARVEANSAVSVYDLLLHASGQVGRGTTVLIISSDLGGHLTETVSTLTSMGAHSVIAYLDASSFPASPRLTANMQASRSTLAGLAGVGATTFVLKYQSEGGMLLEAVNHGSNSAPLYA